MSPKSVAKAIIRIAMDHRYHRHHAGVAMRRLAAVERYRGRIGRQERTSCDDYAIGVLGHRHFAPWLYVYTAVSGRFREGWIPDNFYGAVVVPALKGYYGKISVLKPLNTAIFRSDLFPDLLSHVNGIFFDPQYRRVSARDVEALLFREQDRVVFKADASGRGEGVTIMTRDQFRARGMHQLGNGLFQRYVRQHEVLSQFAEGSVATLRLTTVYGDDGDVSVRAAYLRFGSGQDTLVKPISQVRVPLDLSTGAFRDLGYTAEWDETEIHPTSKVRFSGNTAPNFSACIESVKELHRKVPYVRCVGWDVTVDHGDRVQIMEWNATHNGITFGEATQGPCFADLGWERLRQRSCFEPREISRF